MWLVARYLLFFIFPGQRMMPDLMKDKSHDAAGTVTASGWSNAQVFRENLQDHFMKHVQGLDSSEPILILYDGHRSHFSLDLIEWAKTNNIILFVLPPHCSHILQPMDVGCFGPSKSNIGRNARHLPIAMDEWIPVMMFVALPARHIQLH